MSWVDDAIARERQKRRKPRSTLSRIGRAAQEFAGVGPEAGVGETALGVVGSAMHAPKRMVDIAANYYSNPILRSQVLGGAEPVPTGALAAEALFPAEEAKGSYLKSGLRAATSLGVDLASDPLIYGIGAVGAVRGTVPRLLERAGAKMSRAPLLRAGKPVLDAAGRVMTEPAAVIGLRATAGAPRIAQRALSGYFAGSMGIGTIEGAKQTAETVGREGFSPLALEQGLGTVGSGLFAYGAGKHALFPRPAAQARSGIQAEIERREREGAPVEAPPPSAPEARAKDAHDAMKERIRKDSEIGVKTPEKDVIDGKPVDRSGHRVTDQELADFGADRPERAVLLKESLELQREQQQVRKQREVAQAQGENAVALAALGQRERTIADRLEEIERAGAEPAERSPAAEAMRVVRDLAPEEARELAAATSAAEEFLGPEVSRGLEVGLEESLAAAPGAPQLGGLEAEAGRAQDAALLRQRLTAPEARPGELIGPVQPGIVQPEGAGRERVDMERLRALAAEPGTRGVPLGPPDAAPEFVAPAFPRGEMQGPPAPEAVRGLLAPAPVEGVRVGGGEPGFVAPGFPRGPMQGPPAPPAEARGVALARRAGGNGRPGPTQPVPRPVPEPVPPRAPEARRPVAAEEVAAPERVPAPAPEAVPFPATFKEYAEARGGPFDLNTKEGQEANRRVRADFQARVPVEGVPVEPSGRRVVEEPVAERRGAAPAEVAPAAPKPKPEPAAPKPSDIDARLRTAWKDVAGPGAEPNAVAYVPRLREALRDILPGERFDEYLLDLQHRGLAQLQRHPTPADLTAAEREAMVKARWNPDTSRRELDRSPSLSKTEYQMAFGYLRQPRKPTAEAKPAPKAPAEPTPPKPAKPKPAPRVAAAPAEGISVTFAKSPSAAVRKTLKRAGFVWDRKAKAYVAPEGGKAEKLARRLEEKYQAKSNLPTVVGAKPKRADALEREKLPEPPLDAQGNRILPGQEGWSPEERGIVHETADAYVRTMVQDEAAEPTGRHVIKDDTEGPAVFVKRVGVTSPKRGTPLKDIAESPKQMAAALKRDKGNKLEKEIHEAIRTDPQVEDAVERAEAKPARPTGLIEKTAAGEQRLIPGALGIQRPTRTEGREGEGPLFKQEEDARIRAEERSQMKLGEDVPRETIPEGQQRYPVKAVTPEETAKAEKDPDYFPREETVGYIDAETERDALAQLRSQYPEGAELGSATMYSVAEKYPKPGDIPKAVLDKMSRYMKTRGFDVRGSDDARDLLEKRDLLSYNETWQNAYRWATGRRAAQAAKRAATLEETPHVNWKTVRGLGTTSDPLAAGYVRPDGKMLDLSGGGGRVRGEDHRVVGGTAGMQELMGSGYIRWMPEANGLDVAVEPTPQQFARIRKLAEQANGEVLLDLQEGLGEYDKGNEWYRDSPRKASLEYPSGTRPERVVGDIRRFFAGEDLPTGPRFSVAEKSPPFFSHLRNVVDKIKQPSASAGDVLKFLKSPKHGVKAEELRWTGLEQFLRERKGKVTKQELQDFLDANDVEIEEVVKGRGLAQDEQAKRLEALAAFGRTRTPEQDAEYEALASRLRHGQTFLGEPKFGAHTLPGAKEGSYRELLLTLGSAKGGRARLVALEQELRDLEGDLANLRFRRSAFLDQGGEAEQFPGTPEYSQKLSRAAEIRDQLIAPDRSTYTEGHWDEPNVLAHVRFNERVGPNGERVLFVEEVQSDWHASLRKEKKLTGKEYAPPAPFGAGTKSPWHEMVMRRMTRWAAEEGLDKLAWINGEETAKRYDLSKQVSRVEYTEDGRLVVYDLEGREVMDQKVAPGEIENHIGKDPARRLLEATPEESVVEKLEVIRTSSREYPFEVHRTRPNIDPDNLPLDFDYLVGRFKTAAEAQSRLTTDQYETTKNARSISGEGLKVGGEWAKNLYDVMIPSAMRKFGKQWGAEVKETKIETESATGLRVEEGGGDPAITGQPPRNDFDVLDRNDNPVEVGFDSRAEAKAWIRENYPEEATKGVEMLPFQSMAITPEMRRSVVEKGVPKFAAKTGQAPAAKDRAQARETRAKGIAAAKRALPGAKVESHPEGVIFTMPNGKRLLLRPDASITLDEAAFKAGRGRAFRPEEEFIAGSFERTPSNTVSWDGVMQLSGNAPRGTEFHEAYHWAKAAALNAKQRAEIEAMHRGGEEVEADAFAAWMLKPTKHGPFQQILRFVQRLYRAFRPTAESRAESVFEDIASGRVWRQRAEGARATPGRQFASRRPLPEATNEIGPDYMRPVDPDANRAKVERLARSMRKDGWRGPPVLAVEETHDALTGSHRIAAAKAAKLGVPTFEVSLEDISVGMKANRGVDPFEIRDQERLDWFREAAKKTGLESLADAARLMEAEAAEYVERDKRSFAVAPIPKPEAPKPRREPAPEGTYRAAEEGLGDRLIRHFQDKYVRLKRTVEAVKERGGRVTEETDPYLAVERFDSVTAERLRDSEREFADPLVAALAKPLEIPQWRTTPAGNRVSMEGRTARASLEELGDYMSLRHAPTRDQIISERTKGENKHGSGWSPEEADATWQALEQKYGSRASGKLEALEPMAKIVREAREKALEVMVEGGLLSKEQAKGWRDRFGDDYVPLRTAEVDAELQAGPGTGQGFSIKGRESKSATGRSTKADNPVVFMMAELQRAIVRAEKNKVDQTFARFVEENPDPTLWEVDAKHMTPEYDKATKEVKQIRDLGAEREDVGYKVDGESRRITVRDPLLLRAMKNLSVQETGEMLRKVGGFTRFYSQMVTSWNPEFIVSNFARDVQQAMANVGVEQGAKIAKKIPKSVLPAMKGMMRLLRNKDASGKWETLARELREDGGTIGFYHLKDIAALEKQMGARIRASGPGAARAAQRALTGVRDLVEDVNKAVENGTRLAVYAALRESGASRIKAASVAKNVTLNFNRKGEAGAGINSLYVFFNASMQGTKRLADVLRTQRGQKLAAGIIAAGWAMDQYNRAAGGDSDDDGTNDWDAIPPWVKERNLILMRGEGEKPIMFPMPYGYNVLHNLGQLVGATTQGNMTPTRAAGSMASSLWNSFNPLGSEADLAQVLSPTALDPIIQHEMNKDFTGRRIRPDRYPGQARPDSELYFRNVPPLARGLAGLMNRATGGDKVTPGLISVSPETLDHFFKFFTGGLGRFGSNVANTLTTLAEGEEPSLRSVPFARRLVYDEHPGATGMRFRENTEALDELWARYTHYRETGDREAAAKLPQAMLRVKGLVDVAESRIRAIRKSSLARPDADARIETIQRSANKAMSGARDAGYTPWTPSRDMAIPGRRGRVRLSDREYAYMERAQEQAAERVRRALRSPGFRRLDPEEQRRRIESLFSRASSDARRRLMPRLRRRHRSEARP